jgi:hypothetical protein
VLPYTTLFLEKYQGQGTVGNLSMAIHTSRLAVKCTPHTSPDFPLYLANHATILLQRFTRFQRLADIE